MIAPKTGDTSKTRIVTPGDDALRVCSKTCLSLIKDFLSFIEYLMVSIETHLISVISKNFGSVLIFDKNFLVEMKLNHDILSVIKGKNINNI